MELTVSTKAFREAVEAAGRAATGNNSLAGQLKLSTKGSELTVSGDNGYHRIEASAEAMVRNGGEAAVPLTELKGFLSKAAGDLAKIHRDPEGENMLVVEVGRAQAKLNLGDPDNFLEWEEEPGGPSAKLPGGQLARQVKQVLPFAQKQGAGDRLSLEGVRMKVGRGRIRLETSDGARMSLSEMDLPEDNQDAKLDVLAPAIALNEVVRNLKGGEEEVLTISGGKEGRTIRLLVSNTGNLNSVEVTSRQMDAGSFPPNLGELVPSEWETHFVVDSADLKRAVEEAVIFAGRENRTAILETRTPDEDGAHSILSVLARSPESGYVHDEILLGQQVEGEEAWVAMRCGFLLDAVNAAGSDELDVEIGGEGRPCVFRQSRAGDEESEVTIVMMPLMVAKEELEDEE